MVGHIWNVSGIRAMPSHVNNQKLQPRFQRVSGHTAHVCRIYVCTAGSIGPAIAGLHTSDDDVCTRVCMCMRASIRACICIRLTSAYQTATHLSPRVALADTSAPWCCCLITRASNWRVSRHGEQLLRGGRRRGLFPEPLLAERTPRLYRRPLPR